MIFILFPSPHKIGVVVITIILSGALMSAIDEGNKDEDGFLRMIYTGDRALGSVEMLPVRTSVN